MGTIEQEVSESLKRDIAATYALLKGWSGRLQSEMRQNAGWTDQTAHARQALHSDVERVGEATFHLYAAHGKDYGLILEDGSKPHDIVAKNKKALFWTGARHPVKKVRHPGTRAYPIVGSTMEKHADTIVGEVVELWEAS